MAAELTATESARIILSIFYSRSVRSGQVVMAGAVNADFLKLGYGPENYKAGMDYAVEQGWIREEPPVIRLTEVGYDAMEGLR